MKVILIQIDGKMPNLALMKLSSHHKNIGDEVALIRMKGSNLGLFPFKPDFVYVSCIFSENKGYAYRLKHYFEDIQGIQIGGCGLDNDVPLPDFIEHLCPDYSLYNIDYSMGFTSRGCIRSCPWCIVPKNEGKMRNHAPLEEFLQHKKVILFDNNFLASPKCRENLDKIIDQKIKVNFGQGLDIRLINDENAELLSECRYYNWKFKNRTLYFAFDTLSMEKDVKKGIEILDRHGVPRRHLMFFVLIGFNTSFKEDMKRINFLIDKNIKPYVMPYNNRQDSYYPHLSRWINRGRYEFIPLSNYDHGNSKKILQEFI